MILSESVGGSLMWIIESFIVILLIVWRYWPPKRWWGHLLMLAAIVGCFFGGFRVDNLGSHVAIVKIGPSGHPVEKTRGLLYFGKSYTMQNGAKIHLAPASDRYACVIVNDSDKTLRIESQQYAQANANALMGGDSLQLIEPFSVKRDGPSLAAIGPDEELPSQTEGVAALNVTFLFRLTWTDAEAER